VCVCVCVCVSVSVCVCVRACVRVRMHMFPLKFQFKLTVHTHTDGILLDYKSMCIRRSFACVPGGQGLQFAAQTNLGGDRSPPQGTLISLPDLHPRKLYAVHSSMQFIHQCLPSSTIIK